MRETTSPTGAADQPGTLVLGIDTCGPSGSVALGRRTGAAVEILGQVELEGRSYSATLVAAVGDLLAEFGVGLRKLEAIVAVNGPGSFTGVRVGLSAVKGLADLVARKKGGAIEDSELSAGSLMATGLVAGGALTGVVVAILNVFAGLAVLLFRAAQKPTPAV